MSEEKKEVSSKTTNENTQSEVSSNQEEKKSFKNFDRRQGQFDPNRTYQKKPVEKKKDEPLKVLQNDEDVMKEVLHTTDQRVVAPKSLLNANCHFGHKDSNWNPKMRKYIYGVKNHLHIIDLNKTAVQIQIAYEALKNIVSNGGKVLFVGTKSTANKAIKEEAIRSGSFYVARRWLGGTLTNFGVIYKRIQLLKQLDTEESQGLLDLLPKKQAAERVKLKDKLSLNLEGLKEIRFLPNAIVIVDPRVEHNAVAEAKLLHIPLFILADTNTDPDGIDYLIPCNDESETATRLVIGLLADAVVEGKGGEPLYAYKDVEETAATMNEILKGVDPQEQIKQIKSKLKTDSLLNRKKKRGQSQYQYKDYQRPYNKEEVEQQPTDGQPVEDAPQASEVKENPNE